MQNGSPMPAVSIVNYPLNNGGQRVFNFDPPLRNTQLEYMFEPNLVAKRITDLLAYRVKLSKDFVENRHSWERHMELANSTDTLLVYWNNHFKNITDLG
jgi:hypothetical protein